MQGTIQAELFDEWYLRSTFASLLGISAAHVALSTKPASTHVMSLLVITLATTAEAGPILTSIQEAAEALRTNFTQIDGLSDVMCLDHAPPPSPPPPPPSPPPDWDRAYEEGCEAAGGTYEQSAKTCTPAADACPPHSPPPPPPPPTPPPPSPPPPSPPPMSPSPPPTPPSPPPLELVDVPRAQGGCLVGPPRNNMGRTLALGYFPCMYASLACGNQATDGVLTSYEATSGCAEEADCQEHLRQNSDIFAAYTYVHAYRTEPLPGPCNKCRYYPAPTFNAVTGQTQPQGDSTSSVSSVNVRGQEYVRTTGYTPQPEEVNFYSSSRFSEVCYGCSPNPGSWDTAQGCVAIILQSPPSPFEPPGSPSPSPSPPPPSPPPSLPPHPPGKAPTPPPPITSPSPPPSVSPSPPPVNWEEISKGAPGSAPACYGNLPGVTYTNPLGGACIWDDAYCVRLPSIPNLNQCAIPEDQITEKCGAWEDCAGVVCKAVYNGYCLARKVWDDTRKAAADMYAYKKAPTAAAPP